MFSFKIFATFQFSVLFEIKERNVKGNWSVWINHWTVLHYTQNFVLKNMPREKNHLLMSSFFWLFTGTYSAVSESRQSQQQHPLFCFLLAVLNYSWHFLTPINAFNDFFRLRMWESLMFIGKINIRVHLTLTIGLTGPIHIIFVFLINSYI